MKPTLFTHGEKTYSVSWLTDEKKAEYEQTMQAKALLAVRRLKGKVPPEEYREAYAEALEAVGDGRFAFHSPFTQASLQTHGGVVSLGCILFGVEEAEMLSLFAARGEEIAALLKHVLERSMPDPTRAG